MIKYMVRFGLALSLLVGSANAALVETEFSGVLNDTLDDGGVTLYEYSESVGGFYNWYSIENNSGSDIAFFAVTTGSSDTFTALDTWLDTENEQVVFKFVDWWTTSFVSVNEWNETFGEQYGSYASLFGNDEAAGVNWYSFNFDAFNPLTDGSLSEKLIQNGETHGDTGDSPFQFFGAAASQFVAFGSNNNLIAQSANPNGTAVPAPATFSVFALGLILLALSRRLHK